MQLLVPLVLFGLMWVLLVRPQKERVRRQQQLVASLEVGDEVITAGGLIGRIVALDDNEAHIEVAPGSVMRFLRIAVNARVGDDAGDQAALTEPELTETEPERADDRGGE